MKGFDYTPPPTEEEDFLPTTPGELFPGFPKTIRKPSGNNLSENQPPVEDPNQQIFRFSGDQGETHPWSHELVD